MEYQIGTNPCPRCRAKGRDRAGNNFHYYGEGLGGHCWSCHYTELSDEEKERRGLDKYEWNEDEVSTKEIITPEELEEVKSYTGTKGQDQRGITDATYQEYRCRFKYSEIDGTITEVFYPYTQDYKAAGFKVRKTPVKDFYSVGKIGKQSELFGQWKWRNMHSKYVVLCAGELDALSTFQMLENYRKSRGSEFAPIPVVSSAIGESGSYKQVQLQYEWLNQFERVIVCYDNDPAGKEAVEKLFDVIPKGKMFVMRLTLKDANKYLEEDKQKQFIQAFYDAKSFTPNGVKSASDGMDEIRDELMKERITLPPYMHKMQEMMGGGIQQGRICNTIAFTSSGKSSHVNRMVYHWIFHSPVTPTIVTLEATAAQFNIEMLSIHLKSNLLWNLGEEGVLDFLDSEEGKKAMQELCFKEDGTPRYFLIDEREGNIKDLEEQVELLWKKHDSRLLVIDVLSDLLRGSSEQHAEDHMSFQRRMAKNGVTIMNVLHTRKPPQSKEGEVAKVTEYDALGTGSFVQSAAVNIVLNRDKMNESELTRNTTEASLAKCRGGKTGLAGHWYYDFPTATCYDLEDYLSSGKGSRSKLGSEF